MCINTFGCDEQTGNRDDAKRLFYILLVIYQMYDGKNRLSCLEYTYKICVHVYIQNVYLRNEHTCTYGIQT